MPSPSQGRIDKAVARYASEVKRRREQSNLTQTQAARQAGISQSHWSKIERGKIRPSIEQILRIHAALDAESLESYFGAHPVADLVGRRWP